MAKISPILGTLSGKIAGNVFSHNRGGQYVRQRTVPVNPTTTPQTAARNILAIISASWNGLTDGQRIEWESWAAWNPVVDSLGQSVQLTGHQAFCGINSRLAQAAGTLLTGCPTSTGPADLDSVSIVATAPSAVVVTYTPTPLAAGERILVWQTLPAVVSRNPNRRQARLIGISAAAAASPQTFASRFNAVAGQASNFWVARMNADGLVSPGIRSREVWV